MGDMPGEKCLLYLVENVIRWVIKVNHIKNLVILLSTVNLGHMLVSFALSVLFPFVLPLCVCAPVCVLERHIKDAL